VLIFQVSKNYRKNRKQTAILSHQKISIIAKNPLVQIIIALSLRINYRKMSSMRLPSLLKITDPASDETTSAQMKKSFSICSDWLDKIRPSKNA